ncbi:hypothetical protein [Streptosporangium sp. KLBMP 9127]|nr:hypothetical protein [Streptosporangium sp. KLBMP 9127]
MLAIIAAIVFGLGLLFDLVDIQVGDGISGMTFMLIGLLLLALHQAGIGTSSFRSFGGRSRARR